MSAAAPRIRVCDVLAIVARHYGISVGDMLSATRQPRISRPRAAAIWLAWRLTDQTMTRIGRAMAKDWTTIRYHLKRVETARAADAKLARDLASLEQTIREAAQ